MKKVLEIFSFPTTGGYFGGVATMVSTYMKEKEAFSRNNYALELFNYEFKRNTNSNKVDFIVSAFSQRKALKKLLSQNRYDLVHIHTSRQFLFLKDIFLLSLIHRFSIPVIITVHVGKIETVFQRIKWFEGVAIRILNKKVSNILFLAKSMNQEFIEHGLRRDIGQVLYNFHDIRHPINCNVKSPNKDRLNLLFVGSIHREKGIMELLEAIKILKRENIHLDICGLITDVSIKKQFENYSKELSDVITLHGYVTGAEKAHLFKEADVLVLPSYHEGLPLVILEALGAGCAIVSTPVGAIPEILSDNNALWVAVGSSIELANRISDLNANRQLLSQMQSDNYLLGKEYELSKHIDKLCAIYDKTINKWQRMY